MDTSPLVRDEIDAGREFLKQLDAFKPVVAACWLREDEDAERYLYVALDGLTQDQIRVAYGEVSRITQAMKDIYVDPFRVKLITPDHPVAKAVMELYRRHSGRIPTPLNGRSLAGVPATEVYIYPPLSHTP